MSIVTTQINIFKAICPNLPAATQLHYELGDVVHQNNVYEEE